jgi:hypothetical protein
VPSFDDDIVEISNVQRGRRFQEKAQGIMATLLGEPFDTEVWFAIGSPPKERRFDLASRSRSTVCECKAFTWTASGNVPSAKITTLREAAQYLLALSVDTTKVIVMNRSLRSSHPESLAEYFCRLNSHLLGSIHVLEIDDDGTRRWIRGGLPAA